MKTVHLAAYLIIGFNFLTRFASHAADVHLPSLDAPYDHFTYLATHNAYSNPDEGFLSARSNQPHSISDQLDYGVRIINLDLWLIRQRANFLGCWIWEEYTGTDTTPGNRFSTKDPLQVVVAHGLDMPTADDFHPPCDPWKLLKTTLNEIGDWMEDHPNEVITISYETKLDSAFEVQYINPAINESRMAKYIFHPSGFNPAVPAPGGRAGGWNVDRYGYPTLRQLVDAGKRVVMFPPYLPRRGGSWHFETMTVYGHECLPPFNVGRKWILPRDESAPIDDFTRRLFSVVHVPDLPGVSPYDGELGINDIGWFALKWQDIADVYKRLPNFIWIDYYDRGYNRSSNSSDPPGPAMFVNFLNGIWATQPTVTVSAGTSPRASSYGWHNTNVAVRISAVGDTIQAITANTFGANLSTIAVTNSYLLVTQGVTTVAFSAVGGLGKRSRTGLLDVSIDKTFPTITGALDRPPDHAGWYTSNVTARFECADDLSGIAFCTSDVVLTADGAGQSVSGTAIDRADNKTTTTITNINIDKNPPVIRARATPNELWPPNGKFVPVVITGTITDAASGVNPGTTSYLVKDEYSRVQPAGRVVLGRNGSFSVTLQLEADRRGGDLNGRLYRLQLSAADYAGHATQFTVPLLVPHSRRQSSSR
ncbi:MAG TPA: hypothetical protein VJ063_00680 [Verrucomicrobiae bacterium]|nr:hypothetical protein [Verrucomicrobiae bacterium]